LNSISHFPPAKAGGNCTGFELPLASASGLQYTEFQLGFSPDQHFF